ncbi:hypothetical protein EUGRSUZ_H03149 [Eucalyptus grandis]|uniref:Uncharacterized protein n=2 Tax=Eucalyptus grandis TaxID=71139 RepID=A0ACC3JTZ1_EUCGR|nr:hypothetical protein EUGRSUZ_H03149 [Eucalyptus grandis]
MKINCVNSKLSKWNQFMKPKHTLRQKRRVCASKLIIASFNNQKARNHHALRKSYCILSQRKGKELLGDVGLVGSYQKHTG